MSHDSRIIVLTGITRGLGRALARGFAAVGHIVIGCGRTSERVSALRDELCGDHQFDAVDVTSDRQVAEWAGAVLDRFGPPDLLINNAAIINANACLWDVPAAEFSDVVDVNIKGVANVIRHFVPAMVERKRGVIVNFSSGWGRSTSPEVAPYCATKWAVEGLSKALAQELPHGMASVPVNPGIINTDMLQSCFADGASGFPKATAWAETAVPFFLSLGPDDNGESLSV